jgi:RNA polymerase sigma-70 factor, ECF subfamily
MPGGLGALERVSREEGETDRNTYTPGLRGDFDRLYRVSYSRVVRTLLGIVGTQEAAEDCAQESFAKALGAWSSWRGDVPAEAWLHRIAVNTAMSHRRREQIRALPSLLRRLGAPPPGPDPAERAQSRSVLAELRTLPPKQAAALILRHYHGYTNREIATALGVSERTVGQRIADGLRKMRERLVAESDELRPAPARLPLRARLRTQSQPVDSGPAAEEEGNE